MKSSDDKERQNNKPETFPEFKIKNFGPIAKKMQGLNNYVILKGELLRGVQGKICDCMIFFREASNVKVALVELKSSRPEIGSEEEEKFKTLPPSSSSASSSSSRSPACWGPCPRPGPGPA